MTLDFRNVNTLWCSIIAETFYKLGLTKAVICPGSRSTPLTVAFAQHQTIETIPILDERSASFFALGMAKKSGVPTILICTSGTAGANFYPAVIEAKYSNVPLIILTADRPKKLRNCYAGQTIEQINLYSNYPNWHTELALPYFDKEMLFYLRQNMIHAWEKSLFPYGGVVHLNLPFDEPLVPVQELEIKPSEAILLEQELLENIGYNLPAYNLNIDNINSYIEEWKKCDHASHAALGDRGIIIAGVDHSFQPQVYCQAIANLAKTLQFPVLAEALSPVRNYADINPYLIITYDSILRNSKNRENLQPKTVIQIGKLPTCKELRNWLNQIKPKTYIIQNTSDNIDALHSNSIHLRISIENLQLNSNFNTEQNANLYLKQWLNLEQEKTKNINQKLTSINNISEAKVAWILSKNLPKNTPIFIANSMSVRYCEFFWQKNRRKIRPYFSRGANGIDGTLSTALGIAYQNQSTVMLTGDLALLHDINGFLINKYFQGHLTIIVINNNGGGIFEMLPIVNFEPPFEEYFATPQQVDFANICQTYNVEYQLIKTWDKLEHLLNDLPTKGIRVLELKTNRKNDALWLKKLVNNIN